MNALKDIDGKESSKRKLAQQMAISSLAVFWLYTALWIYMSLFTEERTTPEMPDALFNMWVGITVTALGAIGFTIGERIWQKNGLKNKKQSGNAKD